MTTKIYNSYYEFSNRENKSENGVSTLFAENNPNFETDNNLNESCWDCCGCRDCRGCCDCCDCRGCSDCCGCRDCRGCSGCCGCRGCRGCSGCSGCSGCRGCSGCSDCRGCCGCSGCRGCSGCSDCRDCRDCRGCCDCGDCRGCRDCRGCCGCSDCGDLLFVSNNHNYKELEETKQEFATFAGLKIPIIPNIHQKILEAVKNRENNLNMSDWHHGNVCGTTHCRAGWVTTLAGEQGLQLEKISDTCFAAMMIYKYSSPEIRVSPNRFFEDNETAMRDIEKCAEKEANL